MLACKCPNVQQALHRVCSRPSTATLVTFNRTHGHAAAGCKCNHPLSARLLPGRLLPAQATPQDSDAAAGPSTPHDAQQLSSRPQPSVDAQPQASPADAAASSGAPVPASQDAPSLADASPGPGDGSGGGDGSSSTASGSSTPPSGAGATAPGGGGTGSSGGGGGGGAPSAVTLLTRYNGIGYTFVLAGFLKIVTIGGLAASAPTDMARTAFGKASPYLLVPVGLGMAWAAKQVVDSGMHEDKKFMRYLVGVLVLLYFGLVKLMYRYQPDGEWVRRPRPRLPGQMSDLRADLGDRDLLAGAGDMDTSRSYQPDRPGRDLYDDVAWYEGRYPSQLAGPRSRRAGGGGVAGAAADRMSSRAAALAATDTDDYGGVPNLDALTAGRSAAEPTITVKPSGRRSFLSDNTR